MSIDCAISLCCVFFEKPHLGLQCRGRGAWRVRRLRLCLPRGKTLKGIELNWGLGKYIRDWRPCLIFVGRAQSQWHPCRFLWNSPWKKCAFHWESFWEEMCPGTGNEITGGGVPSGIRRKTSSLFCGPWIGWRRGLQTPGTLLDSAGRAARPLMDMEDGSRPVQWLQVTVCNAPLVPTPTGNLIMC